MTMQQVHIRINDAATGQPTPIRLRITDADGTYYAPYGRLTEFATGVNQDVGGNVMIGAKKWCYIDGTCEILLPPGKLHVEITKGPEYTPIDEEITLLAGKMSLRFTIERWSDVRKDGWYSGDARVHFLSPDAALLEGQAEDVAVVNLLVSGAEKWDSNILSFSGQSFAREAGGCGVAVNTHNINLEFGGLGLLHCHRVVYPLKCDGRDWTLDDWCGQCHRRNGLVVWVDPYRESSHDEALADLVLGNVDAFELSCSWLRGVDEYQMMLDAGLSVPLVGASGKTANDVVVGAMRTYAFVTGNEKPSYSQWVEAVRAGPTYISNGPLLHFTIGGKVPPALIQGRTEEIQVEAKSDVPFDRVELVWNGEVIESSTPATRYPCQATIRRDTPLPGSGWLAVRCKGQYEQLMAHSSGILVQKDGEPFAIKPIAVKSLLDFLNSMRQFALAKHYSRLTPIVEQARTVLAKKLSSS